ncbi:MAG: tetratricopeptide repeat protein [Candidatus Thiodiazotropha sp.]
MPKFSLLTWVVIIVAQVTYGLLVFAITSSYYQGKQVVAVQSPPAVADVPPHPKSGAFDANLQPAMQFRPSPEALSSDDPALIARLADDYFMKKDYPQAIELYERVLQIDPDDVETYNDLGLSLFYIGQTERALQALQTGADKQPGFQRIQLTLGFVQTQAGNRDAAATAFRKAIELGADNRIGLEAKRMLGEIE